MDLGNARAIPITSSALNCPRSLCQQLAPEHLKCSFIVISGQLHEVHFGILFIIACLLRHLGFSQVFSLYFAYWSPRAFLH